MINDRVSRVPIATNPPGANVYINGTFVGQTPMYAPLPRGSAGLIQIYLPGFEPVTLRRGGQLSGWFIASCALFWLFFIPPVVDLATGAYITFDDSAIAIPLLPARGPPPNWYDPNAPVPQPPQPPPMPPAPYVPPGTPR
jgi:PEGA domain-containing protein